MAVRVLEVKGINWLRALSVVGFDTTVLFFKHFGKYHGYSPDNLSGISDCSTLMNFNLNYRYLCHILD
jgi:hypothetical protein